MQLSTIPTHLVAGSQGEELSTSLSTSPPQGAVGSNEVAPQPPSLQTRQNWSPQPLLTGHSIQPCHRWCCPPLDTFKDLHSLLKLQDPELPMAPTVRPHQRCIQPLAARARIWLLLSPLPTSTLRALSAWLLASHASRSLHFCPHYSLLGAESGIWTC